MKKSFKKKGCVIRQKYIKMYLYLIYFIIYNHKHIYYVCRASFYFLCIALQPPAHSVS